ncbi:hypothetical protein CSB11_01220 [Candidatus Campbellbacteria bacterium]|nr:MAG: hypothetical protein CSB11_01220 [Candidatus Campbellbacteria bacterium]
MDKKQLEKWLEAGVIDQNQAEKMLQDLEQQKKEKSSSRVIWVFSIIGSVLLGLGVILFMASNWSRIPDFGKIGMLVLGTFGTFFVGYYLKEQKKNYPKVGFSLIFLSAFLFGATIFLIAQIYHTQADEHSLVLLWLLGVLPLVYVFGSRIFAFLSSMLFYTWMILFFIQKSSMFKGEIVFYIIFTLSILLFVFGNLHFFKKSLEKVGLVYKIFGFFVTSAFLYLVTFPDLASEFIRIGYFTKSLYFPITFMFVLIFLALTLSSALNPNRSENNRFENISLLLGSALVFGFSLFDPEVVKESIFSFSYIVFYNIVFFGMSILLVYKGYKKEKMVYVNFGIFYLCLFLISKYFDLFYQMLDRSVFFIIGGIILIAGGFYAEKKRRKMKEDFLKNKKDVVNSFNLNKYE